MAAADAQKDARTVFIRGVSFEATEKDLEEVFSDVGPVKQCFLVKVKGQPTHRGFGFVQYSLPEDAERAVEELQGKSVKGRKLKVELANKRAPLEERKKKRKLSQADGDEGEAEEPADAAAKPAAKQQEEQQQQQPAKQQAAAKSGKAAAAASAAANGDAAAAAAAEPPVKRQKPAAAAADGAAKARDAKAAAAAAEKHKLLRAVAVGNLTPAAVGLAVSLTRKAGPVEEVQNPAPQSVVESAKLAADGCRGHVILVVYKTVKDAMTAVSKLHRQVLTVRPQQQQQQKGGKKGKKGKKGKGPGGDDEEEDEEDGEQQEQEQQRVTVWAREVKGEGALVKQWRVILRNLPFKVTEAQLHKALDPVGFVWELQLPKGPDGRLKGFAFAAFTCRAHAEKAIATVNGKDIGGRTVVVDWAVSKTQYESLKGKGGAGGPEGASEDPDAPPSGPEDGDKDSASGSEDEDGEGEDEDEEGEGEEEDSEEELGLSSDEDGEVMEDDDEEDEEGEDEDEDDEDEEGEEEGEDDEDVIEGEDAEADQEHQVLTAALQSVLAEHEREQQQGQQGQGDKAEGKGKKGQQEARDKGKKDAAAAAGKKPAWQGEEAQDPDAGADGSRPSSKSGGSLDTTVFVRGLPLDITAPQLQARLELFGPVKACRLVIDKASGKPKGTAFVEFRESDPAHKAAEACARGRRNEGPGITLLGRQLEVDVALSGDGARSLATQRQTDKAAGRDRRNLYLSKEGHIVEGSSAWKGMSAHDQAKRKRAAEEKNTKLRSPNFIISRTRLSVRNIPPDYTEGQLRRMFTAAVKERATKENPRIVTAKILREEGKYDASGARKSKGMGFVEFAEHEHALVALRQLNNNPGTEWGRERRPIVEFAIDNVKVLKKLEHLRERAAVNKERQARPQGGSEEHRSGEGAEGNEDQEAAAAAEKEDGGRPAKRQKSRKEGEGAGAEDGAEAAGEDGVQEEQGGKRKDRRKDKKKGGKGEAAAANGHAAAAAAGGGEGEGGEGQLSARQRKRLKQKARVDQKKQLLKEGGVKALVDAVEAKKQGKEMPKAKQQEQEQQQRGRKPQQGAAAAAAGRGGEQGGKRKRQQRAEEHEIDRIAQEGLAASANGHPHAKRRRRSDIGEEDGGDRLDRLVAQYRKKLDGGPGGAAAGGKQQKQKQHGGGKGDKGGKGGQPEGGKGKGGAKGGAAGMAALVAGAAAGGLRRWFD